MNVNIILRFILIVLFGSTPAITLVIANDSTNNPMEETSQVSMEKPDYFPKTFSDGASKVERRLVKPPPGAGTFLGEMKEEQSHDEKFKAGAWLVPVYGRLISIKPGFIRGSSLGDVYNTKPVAMVSDITDFDSGKALVYNYAFPGLAGCYSTTSGDFYFEFTVDKLTLAKCDNGRPDISSGKSVGYKQWLETWAQNASKYCGTVIKNYCFIPQNLMGKERYGEVSKWVERTGFVVSKKSPLSGGGLPADFVELGKHTGHAGWPPSMVASPLLKLIFQAYMIPSWLIYEMTKKEMPIAKQNQNSGKPPDIYSADNSGEALHPIYSSQPMRIETPVMENWPTE